MYFFKIQCHFFISDFNFDSFSEYLYELGRVLHKLANIQLSQCELDEDLENCDNSFVIDGSEIGRCLSLTVNISSEMEVG